MKINGSNPVGYVSQIYKSNGEQARTNKKKAGNDALKDRIELSEVSKDIRKYIDRLESISSEDAGRIERIRQALSCGTYSISSGQLAEAMTERINEQQNERT